MKKFFLIIILFFSFFFFLPHLVLAQEATPSSVKPKLVEVKKGEIINRDFFAAAQEIIISGVINGDVFMAGGNIMIDGTINGDLMAVSNNINFKGIVSDDARLAGNIILIDGLIGKNLTLGGSSVAINDKAKISGSLLAFAGNTKVQGPIGKDARIYGGQVFINNQIGRDLNGAFDELVLAPQTKILGDLDYQSSKEAQLDQGAKVFGQTIYKPLVRKNLWPKPFMSSRRLMPIFFGFYGLALIFKFFALLLAFGFGFLFFYFFPKRIEKMTKIIEAHFWKSLGIGVITLMIFILLTILLLISLIGIPFIFIAFPLFGLLIYFSKLFTSFFVGRRILGPKKNWIWSLIIGLLIYYVLSMIPVINGLTSFVFITVGLGAFILDQKSLRHQKEIVVKSSNKK